MRHILITGGAGFIGSHVVRLFVNQYPGDQIINLDKLTYAGNLSNLQDLEGKPNYRFVKADICDFDCRSVGFVTFKIRRRDSLLAESHVDRSITDPFSFARTNVMGTLTLLQAAKEAWKGRYDGRLFYHISTDEVYGALGFDDMPFTEESRYDPHSPTPHQRHHPITLYGLIMTPMACQSLFPIVPTITDPISFPKN